MSAKRTYILVNSTARNNAIACVLEAPSGYAVEVKPQTRNLEQNAKLHAVLQDIAEQVEWHGQRLSVDIWKRLCTAAWLREEKEQPMMIPALDGNGFDVIFEHTSKLTVAQCASLIEWCMAFGAENSVEWHDV